MTVLEASKSTNARADGFAALRAGKTACSSTSLKVTTRWPLTVTEVAFPLLVNDHERPSPDGATQGSSV
jgi:hypothetical protein